MVTLPDVYDGVVEFRRDLLQFISISKLQVITQKKNV